MWNEKAGSPSKNADNGSSKVDRCPPGTREKLVLEDLRGGKFYQERSRGEEFRESIPLAILLRAHGSRGGCDATRGWFRERSGALCESPANPMRHAPYSLLLIDFADSHSRNRSNFNKVLNCSRIFGVASRVNIIVEEKYSGSLFRSVSIERNSYSFLYLM